MKALILAAGLGTRLRPYTLKKPKPLFTINNEAVLASVIHKLASAGCREIAVNTHHLSGQIEKFLKKGQYPARVFTRYEPVILGTGGAIANLADFWDAEPFFVVNGDIVFDIDLNSVIACHRSHSHPATLVLHDCPEFNTVRTGPDDLVKSFDPTPSGPADLRTPADRILAFTGIQVLDPLILDFIPADTYSSSVDAFRAMLSAGHGIAGHVVAGHYWNDIGTPQRYLAAGRHLMAGCALGKQAMPPPKGQALRRTALAGDGSDRRWSRIGTDNAHVIVAEHGLRTGHGPAEIDAFVDIGRHLHAKRVPVPEIYAYDRFSGIVVMQDLGNTHLQSVVNETTDLSKRFRLYRQAVDILIHFSQAGIRGFDPAWAWQTASYDHELIVEKECRYFLEAYVQAFSKLPVRFADYTVEFEHLADAAIAFSIQGLMHRDFQSRNIMVVNDFLFVIDYQGARCGPLQYDLAALLNDPYTELPNAFREEMLAYAAACLPEDSQRLIHGYRYCALSRGLQVLGAFGFLANVRGKTFFRQYIPAALRSLNQILDHLPPEKFPRLRDLVSRLLR